MKGETGTTGINTAVVFLYKRAASAPSISWTNSLVYNFANKALTSVPSGWSQSIPANNGQPLYVTAATAASREDTDTIAYTEGAAPVELAEDGADGLNSATVVLYKRAASAPSKPTSALTYTFATGVLSGSLSGWTQAMPATDGNPCYRIQATAISTGATDSIAASEWSDVVKVLEDGEDGNDGNDGNDGRGIASTLIEYRAYSSGTSIPTSGWSTSIPSVSAGYYLWTRTTITYTDNTTSVSYSVARQGSNGSDGDDGDPGPAIVYRGKYDSSKTYYGNSLRCDVVYYEYTSGGSTVGAYFVAQPNAGTFSNKVPTNSSYWNTFGSSFDSIATGLLLAEEANIANFIFRNQKMVSQAGASGNENLQLDGLNGIIKLASLLTLSSHGLTMYSGGVEKVKLVNASVGDYDLSLLKASDSINESNVSDSDISTYVYSAGTYVGLGGTTAERTIVTKKLGFFDRGDTISVGTVGVKLTPGTTVSTGYATSMQFASPTFEVALYRDGSKINAGYYEADSDTSGAVQVVSSGAGSGQVNYSTVNANYRGTKTLQVGDYVIYLSAKYLRTSTSGTISSGDTKEITISTGISLTVPKGMDGFYTLKLTLLTGAVKVTTSEGSGSVPTSIKHSLVCSYNKASFGKTIIGKDGMLLTFGTGSASGSGYLLFNSTNFVVAFNQMLFLINKSGIYKSTNGGASLTAL